MKSMFKYLGLLSLMVFSFYYTDKIISIMENKTTLMKDIINNKSSYEEEYVNAIINDKYIIPGVNGIIVNKEKSYRNMKELGVFTEDYLIYDEIKPAISLKDNKNKIIKKANMRKRAVSLLITDSKYLKYFESNKIKVDYLTDYDYIKSNYVEIISNPNNKSDYLDNNNLNNNICIVNKDNKKLCQKQNKYLIEPTYEVNNYNLGNYINEIDSGDIIKISNITMDKLNLLIKGISYRNLDIVFLSKLISEKNIAI